MVNLAVRRAGFDVISRAQRDFKGSEKKTLPYKYEICPAGQVIVCLSFLRHRPPADYPCFDY